MNIDTKTLLTAVTTCFLTLGLSLCLHGCIYFRHDANAAGIVSFAKQKQSKGVLQNLLWYQGRDGDYDYFKYVYDAFAERRFKVKAGEVPVSRVFPLTSDDEKWIYVPSIDVNWKFNAYDDRE